MGKLRSFYKEYWDAEACKLALTRAKCEEWFAMNGWIRAASPRVNAASEWRNISTRTVIFLYDDQGLNLAAISGITRDKAEVTRIISEISAMK